jgi:hypothetical protein
MVDAPKSIVTSSPFVPNALAKPNAVQIPEQLHQRLPRQSKDGYVYADVKFSGRWDGIVVINSSHEIIGVYVARQTTSWPLSFAADEIEDFRKPCLWNLFLAQFPQRVNPWNAALIAVWFIIPATIIAGFFITPWLQLLPIGLLAFSTRVLYSDRGFPFIRFPTFLFGLGGALWGLAFFLSHIRDQIAG